MQISQSAMLTIGLTNNINTCMYPGSLKKHYRSISKIEQERFWSRPPIGFNRLNLHSHWQILQLSMGVSAGQAAGFEGSVHSIPAAGALIYARSIVVLQSEQPFTFEALQVDLWHLFA